MGTGNAICADNGYLVLGRHVDKGNAIYTKQVMPIVQAMENNVFILGTHAGTQGGYLGNTMGTGNAICACQAMPNLQRMPNMQAMPNTQCQLC